MTTTPDPAPAAAGAAPGTDGPPAADGGMGDKVDVRSLAAQRPGEAMWLLVTEIDGRPGRYSPRASCPARSRAPSAVTCC